MDQWLQAAEERAAKEADLRLLQEETRQHRSGVFLFQRRAAQQVTTQRALFCNLEYSHCVIICETTVNT